jgi:hypothetical protein
MRGTQKQASAQAPLARNHVEPRRPLWSARWWSYPFVLGRGESVRLTTDPSGQRLGIDPCGDVPQPP